MKNTHTHTSPIAARMNRKSSNRIDATINEQVNIFQMAFQPLLETGNQYQVAGLTWETLRSGVKAINNGASANEASILAFGVSLVS